MTIMLNWIVFWPGSCLSAPAGRSKREPGDVHVAEPIADSAKIPCSGASPSCRALHVGFFLALAALVVYWIAPQPHDARLRGAGGRVQPGRGRATAASAWGRTTSSRWRSPGLSPGVGGAMDMLGWQYRSRRRTSRFRRSASWASPSRCSAATPRSAWASRRCSSARCSTGTSSATSIRRVQAGTGEQPDAPDPGPRRAVRRRRPAHPLPLAGAQEAAARGGAAAQHPRVG